jgi:hypothetical protein
MKVASRLKVAIALLSIVLLAGCGARNIREAQDIFNTASLAEANLSPDGDAAYKSPLGVGVYTHALSNYRVAVSLLTRELADNRAELDRDKLTGTAWTLKCMALWRISDLDPVPPPKPPETRYVDPPGDEAKQCSEDARKAKVVFGTRDRLLLEVIPSLVDADRGRRSLTYDEAKGRLASSYSIIRGVLNAAPEGHDIIMYLRRVQLRTLRSWNDATRRFSATPQERETVNTAFQTEFCEFWAARRADAAIDALVRREMVNVVIRPC